MPLLVTCVPPDVEVRVNPLEETTHDFASADGIVLGLQFAVAYGYMRRIASLRFRRSISPLALTLVEQPRRDRFRPRVFTLLLERNNIARHSPAAKESDELGAAGVRAFTDESIVVVGSTERIVTTGPGVFEVMLKGIYGRDTDDARDGSREGGRRRRRRRRRRR